MPNDTNHEDEIKTPHKRKSEDKESASSLKWTIRRAALEFGVAKDTVVRGLRNLGMDTARGQSFTTREIFRAIGGDLKFERTRVERAKADALERDNKTAEAELVNAAEVETLLWEITLSPIRSGIINHPKSCARRMRSLLQSAGETVDEPTIDKIIAIIQEETDTILKTHAEATAKVRKPEK
jgi:phage terminase Nu1 subunit (DNA packaging protein)